MNQRTFALWAMRRIDSKDKCSVNKAQRCYPIWTDEQCRNCHTSTEKLKK